LEKPNAYSGKQRKDTRMPEDGSFRFQLSLKDGPDMLNVRGDTFEVFVADVQLAKKSVDPEIARFFSENDTGLGAKKNADLQEAGKEIAKASPTAQLNSITPTCPTCGGTTYAKTVNVKGREVNIHECNQDNGECQNEKGFKTTVWPAKSAKGRDS
jgi:hypothetical protein